MTIGLNVPHPAVDSYCRLDLLPRGISPPASATVWPATPRSLRAALSMRIIHWLGRYLVEKELDLFSIYRYIIFYYKEYYKGGADEISHEVEYSGAHGDG